MSGDKKNNKLKILKKYNTSFVFFKEKEREKYKFTCSYINNIIINRKPWARDLWGHVTYH